MSEQTDKADHDMIVEMHAVLLGSNGQDGVCRRVGSLEKKVTNIIIFLAVLTGTGLVGTGIFELIKAVTT
jgi:hypothetical protein